MSPKKRIPESKGKKMGTVHNDRHGRPARSLARSRERARESLRLTELIREDLVRHPLHATDQRGAIDELIKLMVSLREVPALLASVARAAVRERRVALSMP